MKALLRRGYQWLQMMGFDPRRALLTFKGIPYYLRDRRTLRAQLDANPADFPFGGARPCLEDRFSQSGQAQGHYFHQDLLVARRIFLKKPVRHVDVGSRVDGFVAHVASYRAIEVLDIRPLRSVIPNVTFTEADLMAPMGESLADYCDSLSCLHALEHFGLGRYGDPVRWDGHVAGLEGLHRILKPGGTLYLSVPIGPQRIEFNAHRVFSIGYMLKLLASRFRLVHFSFVDDQGALHEDVELTESLVMSNGGCQYGCGIFELTKV